MGAMGDGHGAALRTALNRVRRRWLAVRWLRAFAAAAWLRPRSTAGEFASAERTPSASPSGLSSGAAGGRAWEDGGSSGPGAVGDVARGGRR